MWTDIWSEHVVDNDFIGYFFKQKTAYEVRISDWSSDVCSSDLYDCFAGSAQNHEYRKTDATLAGPQPQPYFAPCQIKKRNADWGPAEVTRRFNEAQLAFIARVSDAQRSEEHTSELQSLMRISYAVFCLKK